MDLTLAAKKVGYVPYYYLLHALSKYTGFRLTGTPIWEREWEVLLILDACRYDVFEEIYGAEDRFETDSLWSAGSASPEWMFNNFGREYADEMSETAYVTGNPYSSRCLTAERFAHVEEVWRNYWDEDEGTVLPMVLSDEAIRVWKDIDPHRMIVHYMQPHKPYVPASDSEEMERSDFTFNLPRVFTARLLGTYPNFKKAEARRGTISDDELRTLYRENLEYVVETIEKTILRSLDADIVISADHGERLGEDGIYHHPAYTRYPELREVPWVSVDMDTESRYTPRERRPTQDQTDVADRLEDLGYR